ncbi:MAG TPA: flavodoxin family protein [Sedimentisphaerales bacterium]|nr:flavodoxin family protein [Sedimentisphaerales bacterium]
MKAIAFNGSARKDGNTATLIRTVLGELEKEGIEGEMIQLAGTHVHGCIACGQCAKRKDRLCAVTTDAMNEYIAKMDAADAVIIGSPVYFGNVTTETKALIDRSGYVARANDFMFKRKIGAGVIAVRRGGETSAFDAINRYFFLEQMIVPGSSYWNFAFGRLPGEVERDIEGMETMHVLGQNIAWLLKKLHK